MSYSVKIEDDKVVRIYEDGTKVTLAQTVGLQNFKPDSITVTSKEYPVQYTGDKVSAKEKMDIQNFLARKKKEANESESGYSYYIAENKLFRVSKFGEALPLMVASRGYDGKVAYQEYIVSFDNGTLLQECKEKGIPSYDRREHVFYWSTGLGQYKAMMELGDEISNENEIAESLKIQEESNLKGEVEESDLKELDEVDEEETVPYMCVNFVKAGPMPDIKNGDKFYQDVAITSMDGIRNYVPLNMFKEMFIPVQNQELADTCKQMVSPDYKERFKAEYIQLKNRLEGLTRMCDKWDKNELNFKPTCPRQIYDEQMKAMKEYKRILERRAEMEKVDLNQ